MRRVSTFAFATVCLALSACGGGKGSASLDTHPNDPQITLAFLESVYEGQSHWETRKWTKISFVPGVVPAKAAGYIEEGNLNAAYGCFHVIGKVAGDPMESEIDVCDFLVKAPDGGARNWFGGLQEVIKPALADKQFTALTN